MCRKGQIANPLTSRISSLWGGVYFVLKEFDSFVAAMAADTFHRGC